MSVDRRQLERWIGAVLVPEVRVAGTIASVGEVVPSREYLERFPPAGVVAFGRTPSGAVSPTPLIERVRAICRELGNPEPFVACDLEQGAGLHFAEGTRLPPALAIASAALTDPFGYDVLERAGMQTGWDAHQLDVDLVLAPVADVNTRGDNPIIAVRSFGDDAQLAAERAVTFLRGMQYLATAGCAKHFPGHGDTSQDSHVALPRIDRSLEQLRAVEFVPFRALIRAHVDSVMVAHLDVPALTAEPGLPCTLSRRAIECLRHELGFQRVVLSDAMNMGALAEFDRRYVRALEAGCDGLLCPHDPREAAEELLSAALAGSLDVNRLRNAARMMEGGRLVWRKLAGWDHLTDDDFDPLSWETVWDSWLADAGDRALRVSSNTWPPSPIVRCTVRDAWPGSATPEVHQGIASLREQLGHVAEETGAPAGHYVLIPVVCEARAGLGKYGPSASELASLEREVDALVARGDEVALLWFGSPQTVPSAWWTGGTVPIVLAFAPTPPMFAAVARYLAGGSIGRGSLPARLG